MTPSPNPIVLLVADDDHEDRAFAREAFEDSRLANVELPRATGSE